MQVWGGSMLFPEYFTSVTLADNGDQEVNPDPVGNSSTILKQIVAFSCSTFVRLKLKQ